MQPETPPTPQSTICNLRSATCDLRSAGNPRAILGFLGAYAPEELFHAAGFTPVFIFHTPDDEGHARAHLPGFTCWVAGSALDQALTGRLDGLTGVALAQTCDTMQGLTDTWRRNVAHIPLLHFGMPLRLDSPSARAYLLAELRSLRERVQALAGRPIPDHALQESIALYNRTRVLVRRLYAHAADFAPPDLYALVQAAFQTPKETYNEHVARLLEQRSIPPHREGQRRCPHVLLVGSALADPVLFDVIAQAGGRILGDLLDLGERYFAADIAEDGHPLEALADRLLALVPTPTKHHAQSTRAAHLLSLVQGRSAGGVIFARQKFCESHGFDYVQLARALDRAGVPHLLIELEQASQAGQLRTRVEAFVEMLV
jgi:benzoyl-CoA reductase/2-hydroxyglutaryl-CoA dehydratase subunit BcrC/BadD/HgdB